MVTEARMTPKHAGVWFVLVGVVVGVAQTSPRAVADDGVPAVDATPVLNLRLTVSSELPGVSRKALIAETESIWREGHVKLRWLQGSANPQSGSSLRVLVTPRAVTSTIEGQRWTVGELLRFDGSTAIAVASITGAQRIVAETQALRFVDLPAVSQYRLGVVLGRAVAHEIGHYLLATNTHSPYGLMRASIDAREFADLRTGAFRLDREAVAHLAAQASRGRDSGDAQGSEFSYPKD
jgi:hypothetical protein